MNEDPMVNCVLKNRNKNVIVFVFGVYDIYLIWARVVQRWTWWGWGYGD